MAKYKIVALPKQAEYMELDLTPEEIQKYAKGGYIIEDISVPSLNQNKKGGEPKKKKRKTDDYGRYRSEDGNVRTPITPEMQAVMPPDEWGQYIQEFPEVYTTRTREQQEAMNAAKQMEFLSRLRPKGPSYLYLPDGSLRPQAAQSADWVWGLGLGAASGLGKSAVGAAEALGTRALPYIEGALNTSIPRMASIPGATIGNAAGAYFAGDAIVNRLYPSAGKIQEGKYGEAAADIATGVLDLAGANMLSPAYKGAKATVSELGKFLGTEEGLLSNAYKVNPWAFKPNSEAGYRMIGGKEGYLDAVRSGEIRPTGAYDVAHFNIGQPLNPNRLSAEELIQAGSPGGYKGPYMAEMEEGTWQRMSDAFSNNPEMQEQFKLLGKDKDVWQHPLFGNIKVNDPRLKLYKEHWLRGYKEVPKELPGSPNTSMLDDLNNTRNLSLNDNTPSVPPIRPPRGSAQQKALDELELLRTQTITGQENAKNVFERFKQQKLKDLNTEEGRRRIQEHIDDNMLGQYDQNNLIDLMKDYSSKLPELFQNKNSDEINTLIQRVKDHYKQYPREAKGSGLNSWDELTPEKITNAISNANSFDKAVLRINVAEALAKTDPKYANSFIKITPEEYIKRIEQTQYYDRSVEIADKERLLNSSKAEINFWANQKNQLRRQFNEGSMTEQQYKNLQNELNVRLLKTEEKVKKYEGELKSIHDYINRKNAVASRQANTINIGSGLSNIGDLEPTMTHEWGHNTELALLPGTSNSAIDRNLMDELDYLDEAPEYLFKRLDPDKMLQETAPYDISYQGVSKYKNPEGYFKESLKYFLEGNQGVPGKSHEPTAFAVELRPALKRVGLIKNDFDKVTPEMLETLYTKYIFDPQFQFLDLRIFDIINPTEKSFKTLSRNLNKIKGIAPYAIPIGLGVGAASQQENKFGGELKRTKLRKFID
jgi:hypothetical protein